MPKPLESEEILERYHSAEDLVAILARQIRSVVGSAAGIAELESCGREGLLDAARRFDSKRGVPFRSYAQVRIRGAILDGVRAIMPLPRRSWAKLRGLDALARVSASMMDDHQSGAMPPEDPQAADDALGEHLSTMATAMAIGMTSRSIDEEFGEPTQANLLDDPEQATLRSELQRLLAAAISELPQEEQLLIRGHYLEGLRFDAVAARLGLSKSWASRLHRRAMTRLAKRLQRL